MTWYPQDFTRVLMTDMRMRPDPSTGYPGRTYRFYEGQAVFQFGHGLSYSTYSYKFVSVSREIISLAQSSEPRQSPERSNDTARAALVRELGDEFCRKSKTTVTIRVDNHGDMGGRHSVLLFLRWTKQGDGRPMKQLVGFKSVELEADGGTEVRFLVNTCEHLSWGNEEGLMVIEEGWHYFVVGEEEYPVAVVVP